MTPKKILIVDDEEELCELLRLTFEPKKHKVYTANDGEEGLKIAERRKPDLIILDIKMPKMNGYEFLGKMRAIPKIAVIPVVVMTSLTDDTNQSDEDWAKSLEVADFVSKPVEPFHLLERVEKLLS